jgi:outer membrane protein OmpA-like peptidoglycan-associated protein
MRVFLATLIFSAAFHQLAFGTIKIYKVKEYYPDGKLKYEGRYTICNKRDVEHFMDIYEHRKYGKWVYYHPSGGVKRIEYHSKTKSCDDESARTGTWQYYSEEGILYKEEEYEDGRLIYSEKEIYKDQTYLGKIVVDRGRPNFESISTSPSKNLVPNPDFEEYFYKPTHVENDGKDHIEKIIPGWYSPDNGTPDYYNENRSIAGVPDHLNSKTRSAQGKGYIGLMLFFHPKYQHEQWEPQNKIKYGDEYIYSEAIQTKLTDKLKKDETYCFRAQIVLSRNAGLMSDKFGAYFSEDSALFKNNKFPSDSHISFDISENNAPGWRQLCYPYKAGGNETFLTLGRFSSPANTRTIQRTPEEKSELDINNSAYYLLDNIELFKVSFPRECNCEDDSVSTDRGAKILADTIFSFYKIDESRYFLRNVLFEFDKWDIPSGDHSALHQLKSYLDRNPLAKINIRGHTDKTGTASYNTDLSLRRAQSVKNWLVERGIKAERISCSGFGFDMPVNQTTDADYLNRRVEFEILE